MQQLQAVGVTQVNGLRPKVSISMGGVEWQLRRDATDASTSFPHARVIWIGTGSEPLEGLAAHYCWILGIIPPAPGTLERPIEVMYVGFHQNRINMHPSTVSQADLDRMHVYTADSSNFAGDFVNKFLGVQAPQAVAERESIAPWPNASAPVVNDAKAPPANQKQEVNSNDKQ